MDQIIQLLSQYLSDSGADNWNLHFDMLETLVTLSFLNKMAGRSYNDLMQYPIFPFVLAD